MGGVGVRLFEGQYLFIVIYCFFRLKRSTYLKIRGPDLSIYVLVITTRGPNLKTIWTQDVESDHPDKMTSALTDVSTTWADVIIRVKSELFFVS